MCWQGLCLPLFSDCSHVRHWPSVPASPNDRKKVLMERLTLDLPAMYGDHHVTEVRRILLELAGVQEVYASSCFQVVEVTYDPSQTDVEAIRARLEEAGYLGDLPVPAEIVSTSVSSPARNSRHTAAYQQTGRAISFAQNVGHVGRALWPCPGLGTLEEDGHAEKRA